jgi:hypothetical protein
MEVLDYHNAQVAARVGTDPNTSKKTVLPALSCEWLDKNPFVGIKHSIRDASQFADTKRKLGA